MTAALSTSLFPPAVSGPPRGRPAASRAPERDDASAFRVPAEPSVRAPAKPREARPAEERRPVRQRQDDAVRPDATTEAKAQTSRQGRPVSAGDEVAKPAGITEGDSAPAQAAKPETAAKALPAQPATAAAAAAAEPATTEEPGSGPTAPLVAAAAVAASPAPSDEAKPAASSEPRGLDHDEIATEPAVVTPAPDVGTTVPVVPPATVGAPQDAADDGGTDNEDAVAAPDTAAARPVLASDLALATAAPPTPAPAVAGEAADAARPELAAGPVTSARSGTRASLALAIDTAPPSAAVPGHAADADAATAEPATPAGLGAGPAKGEPREAKDGHPAQRAMPELAQPATGQPAAAPVSRPPGEVVLAQPAPAAAPATAAPAEQRAAPTHPVATGIAVGGVPIELGMKSLAGINRFDIRLTPERLGEVAIKLDIGEEGGVKAHLVVDRPETLALLRREVPQLERALEQAGFRPQEGGLNLSLRDPGADASAGQNPRFDGDGRRPAPDGQATGASADRRPDTEPAPLPARTWTRLGGLDLLV